MDGAARGVSISELELLRVMDEADGAGVRLEIHQGLPIWELLASPTHTIEAKRIEISIGKTDFGDGGCPCYSYQDMSIRFPEGSVRRPDISIFCEAPPRTQEFSLVLPRAIVEIVSPGSEIKDFELSPPFYLLHGVADVIVFQPLTGAVAHFRREGRRQLQTPVRIELECGCEVTV